MKKWLLGAFWLGVLSASLAFVMYIIESYPDAPPLAVFTAAFDLGIGMVALVKLAETTMSS